MSDATIACLRRLKRSLQAAANVSNPGGVAAVEALRSGIRIAVDAVEDEIKFVESLEALGQQQTAGAAG